MRALICALALLSFTLTAGAAHPFHVEDMQRLSRLGNPRLSPDGKWVAFTVTRSDVEKNRSVTNIWRILAAGGDPQQITFAEQGFNGNLRWSPDGRYLYYLLILRSLTIRRASAYHGASVILEPHDVGSGRFMNSKGL
jgi:WD40-like Beta Propeller Repeat